MEIQLTVGGAWIPLGGSPRGLFGLKEAAVALSAGLAGVRTLFDSGAVSFEARRYATEGSAAGRFLWRSATMAVPAFADLERED